MYDQSLPNSLLGLLNSSDVQQHARVHPVNAGSSGIEFQAASVGAFGELIKTGVVIDIAKQIPCEFGVRRLDNRASQGGNSFLIAAALRHSKTQSLKAFYGIRLQLESAPSCLFPQGQVGCRVLTEVGALEQVQRGQQSMRITKRGVNDHSSPQHLFSAAQAVQLCPRKIVVFVDTSLQVQI